MLKRMNETQIKTLQLLKQILNCISVLNPLITISENLMLRLMLTECCGTIRVISFKPLE